MLFPTSLSLPLPLPSVYSSFLSTYATTCTTGLVTEFKNLSSRSSDRGQDMGADLVQELRFVRDDLAHTVDRLQQGKLKLRTTSTNCQNTPADDRFDEDMQSWP